MPDTPRHTTVINSDQAVVEVRFAEPAGVDDGTWFRVLNSFVDSGALAGLSPSATKVFLVLLRHAARDRSSLPSREAIMRLADVSKSQLSFAIAELEARGDLPRDVERRYAKLGRRPVRLIRRLPHGAWEVFPDRPFAGRKDTPPPPGKPPDSGPWENRTSTDRGVEDPVEATGNPARIVEKPDLLLRRRDRDVDGGDGGVAALVAKSRGQLSERDVRAMLAKGHSLEAIGDAIANALWKQPKGLRTNVRAYTWHCLSQGYGLFSEVREARTKKAARPPAEQLLDIMRPRLAQADPATRDLLSNAFGDAAMTIARGGVTPAELVKLGADEVFDLVVKRARERLGGAR
jgi:hypothetical protein